MTIQVCSGFLVVGLYFIWGFLLVCFKEARILYWLQNTWERLHKLAMHFKNESIFFLTLHTRCHDVYYVIES